MDNENSSGVLQTSSSYGYAYGSRGKSQQRFHSSNSRGRGGQNSEDTRLKTLIRDIRTELNDTRQFWTELPYDYCRNQIDSDKISRSRGYSETKCWNGLDDTGRYANAIVSSGLAYQDRNPEVRVDINRPDVDINEQIIALRLITQKLESAHKGENVEWPSTSNCK